MGQPRHVELPHSVRGWVPQAGGVSGPVVSTGFLVGGQVVGHCCGGSLRGDVDWLLCFACLCAGEGIGFA